MKKTLKTLLALMAGTMALTACSDDAIVENNNNNVAPGTKIALTFSAHQENDGSTRAAIDGSDSKKIDWQTADHISVFDGSSNNDFVIDEIDPSDATSATFTGEAADVATYTALYPYQSGAALSGEDIKGVVIPATQTATPGSFDPAAGLMMAVTTGAEKNFAFKNVTSYFKFTAPFNCTMVKITDKANGGKMAGTVTLDYNNGNPTATVTADGTSSITLTGTIEQGKTYYIATLPQEFSQGISMYFAKADGTEYLKSTSSSYTLGRNKVSNMGTPALSDENLFPYVTFSAASSQTLRTVNDDEDSKAVEGLEYSVGGGAWITLGTSTVEFGGTGNDLRLRGTNGWGTTKTGKTSDCSTISFGNAAPVACTGDIRTLVDYRNHETVSTANARFSRLFIECNQLTSAPALPATELASSCYASMFQSCSNLTTAPALPATELATGCYYNMFSRCSNLATAPALPAETLADNCYYSMFDGCGFTAAPELPAKTLTSKCYAFMFGECRNLTTAPELPATTLATDCYTYMFFNCKNLTTAPELPATTLVTRCYDRMFYGCTKLNYVKAAFTTTPSSDYTYRMLYNVAATGTFVKSPAATWNVTGDNGVPAGWTVDVDYGPSVAWESALTLGKSEATSIALEVLVATKPAGAHDLNSEGTLWEVLDGTTLRIQSSQGKIIGSYNPIETAGFFQGYSKAETITGLDKLATEDMTTMAFMFSGCEALTSVDVSSFNTAKVTSMDRMFNKCRSLTSLDLRSFNTTNLTDMYDMFLSCESMTSLDLSSFNTAKVTDMHSLFYHNFVLSSLKLSPNFTLGAVTNFGVIFNGTGIRLYPDKGIIYGVTDEAIKTKLRGYFQSNWLDDQDKNTSMKFDGE